MKVMVDIPHEALFKAVEEINKKRDICKILPKARLYCDTEDFMFGGLVCDDRMGGEQTGVAAGHCKNCILEEKE